VTVLHTPQPLLIITGLLQDYCGALQVEGAFAGLSWHDAKTVAATVSCDITHRTDAAEFIQSRADRVITGSDTMVWDNREGVAHALHIAAKLRGL
jgi:hypothetical protein